MFPGSGEIARRMTELDARRRRVVLSEWEQAGALESEGIIIYRSQVSDPILSDLTAAAQDLKLSHGKRAFRCNPGLREGRDISPYQYLYVRDRVWISLPAGAAVPSLHLEYFSFPHRDR
jgi:hypothetical protein